MPGPPSENRETQLPQLTGSDTRVCYLKLWAEPSKQGCRVKEYG